MRILVGQEKDWGIAGKLLSQTKQTEHRGQKIYLLPIKMDLGSEHQKDKQ